MVLNPNSSFLESNGSWTETVECALLKRRRRDAESDDDETDLRHTA